MRLHRKVQTKRVLRRRALKALFCLVIFGLLVPGRAVLAATNPPVPTVLGPSRTVDSQPVIIGVTQNNTRVAVWVDGVFFGHATVKNGSKGTASFAYKTFLHLKPGAHAVVTRAENSSAASAKSKASWFEVESPYPAPVLFAPPVDNEETNSEQPFITGVARNNSSIKVFIDGQLNGQFWVKNDPNGTGSFAYKPFLQLDPGKDHVVYATATDKNGKVSPFSNVIGFSVAKITTTTSGTTSGANTTSPADTGDTAQEKDESGASTSDDAKESDDSADKEENSNEDKADSSSSSDNSTEEAQSRLDNSNTNSSTDEEEEEEADKDDEKDKTNSNETAAGGTDDDQDGNSNLILWLVVIAIVIIIIVTRLTSRPGDQMMGPDSGQKKMFTETKDKNSSSSSMKSTGTAEGPGNNRQEPPPPPPPPASSF